MPDVAHPRPDRTHDAFSRKGICLGWRAPTVHHDKHADERQSIQEEHGPRAGRRHNRATKSGPDGATYIDGDPIQRDRSRKIATRHQIWHDRLPGRHVECAAEAENKGQDKESGRADGAGDGGRTEKPRREQHHALCEQKKPTAIDDIGEGSRGQADEEHRQTRRCLHEGH